MSDDRGESGAGAAVRLDRDGAVAVLTMNRPQRRNALTVELKEALLAAVTAVADDPAVRAVLITGSGAGFCAGQDLQEHATALRTGDVALQDTLHRHFNPIVTMLATMPKPVLAAINGSCAGAGLGLAMACDLRLAAAGARFSTAFAGIGLTADSGLSATLALAVGASRAMELLLLAESFTAEQAAQWGLVRAVLADDELPGAARELARRLAAGPTLAYAAIKRAVAVGTGSTLAQTLAVEAAEQERLGRSRDHVRAVESFLAKQRPTFDGA